MKWVRLLWLQYACDVQVLLTTHKIYTVVDFISIYPKTEISIIVIASLYMYYI